MHGALHYNFPRMRRALVPLAVALSCAACGAGAVPSAPTSVPGQPGGSLSTSVRVIDALTGAPVPGISASFGSGSSSTSDGDGYCSISTETSGEYRLTFSGSPVTRRLTSVRVPGPGTSVSLIPAGFDMTAFDEMFRPAQKLQRWTGSPPLIVLTRQVRFETSSSNQLTVLPDEMTGDERAALVRDLSDGLRALTDRQLGDFSSVTFESPAPGTRVNVMRQGVILVARSRGLTDGSGYWGYGRWALDGSYAVVGGNVMIDADFDGASGRFPQYRRSLRMHELGHALGYNHVAPDCPSVMNSAARLEPNAWDLQAVHIAFQRPTGNTAPDSDPTTFSLNQRGGAVTWSRPIF